MSIEASKTTILALKKNLKLNLLKNVTLYNNVLTNVDNCEVTFNESEKDWESSVSHKNFKLLNQIKILTKKIDTIIENQNISENHTMLIKLDIEGNEFLALEGAYNTISKFEPIIIIEFSRYLFAHQDSKIFLSDFLKKFDYIIYNNNKEIINENEIFNFINELDDQHDTIGNYYLVKNKSKNKNLFLKSYE